MEKDYWQKRYRSEKTNWDIGNISPPLEKYLNQLSNKDLKILIPGSGNSYEAEFLHMKGFLSVSVIDFVDTGLINLKQRCPSFPQANLINTNFFDHTDTYDLIIEQTFFCALSPENRFNYAQKMKSLLKSTGKFIGLLFDRTFSHEGPPFGGSYEEYSKLFSPFFKINTLETCYNSFRPRRNSELFFIFENSIP